VSAAFVSLSHRLQAVSRNPLHRCNWKCVGTDVPDVLKAVDSRTALIISGTFDPKHFQVQWWKLSQDTQLANDETMKQNNVANHG
jgi:hypothetical protein